jgi:hypothetical protein
MSQYVRWPIDKKADKVPGAVSGNLAGLDSSGNLTDSGLSASQVSGYNLRITNLETAAIPILSADPVTPAPGQEWMLHTPEIPQTNLHGYAPITGGVGNFVIVVTSTNPADLTLFGGSTSYGYVSFSKNYMPGPVNIVPSPPNMGHLEIDFGNDKTFDDIVTAFNAWAVANLTAGVAPVVSLSNAADGTLIPDSMQSGVYLQSDGAGESMILKVKSPDTTYTFFTPMN